MTLRHLALMAPLCLAVPGCATSDQETRTSAAIEDFIAVAQLEEVDKVRTRGEYGFSYLTDHYLILETKDADVLVRFQRRCRDFLELPVQPDIRYDSKYLRPRQDTIRGCRIGAMYVLQPGQIAELEYIGESPDDR